MMQENHRWRFVLEFILLLVSLVLTTSYIRLFDWPDKPFVIVFVAWLVYFIVQLKVKLGLTLPFGFIVVWMILVIMDWNENQEFKSFDLEDYQLAIAAVLNALTGAVIYFENKMRW